MTRYKLSEICKIVSGSTPKTNVPEYWDGENVWITPAEITDKTFIVYDSQRKLSNLGVEKTHLSSFPKGTVILSSRAPIGKVAIAGVEMFCNQGFKNLICSEKIMNEYLYWFLKGKTKYLNSLGRGATFKELSAKIIGNIELEVPSIQEQKEVVIRLRKIDQIIGVFEREVELLDELIKARFVEMFGDVQNAKKHSNKQLKDICNTVTGGTPSTKHAEYYNGTIPWISTVSLGPNYIDGTTAKAFITQEAVDNSSTKIIPSGSILFGTRVGVGKSSINQVEMCTNQDIVAIIDLDESKYNKLYIKYVLDTYQSYFDSIKKGATILGISSDDLKNIYIPDASLYEQNRFEKFVKQIDKSRLLSNHSLLLLKSIIF